MKAKLDVARSRLDEAKTAEQSAGTSSKRVSRAIGRILEGAFRTLVTNQKGTEPCCARASR